MTTLTTPDSLVRWTTSDPASIVAQNNQLADSVQAALLLRSAKSYQWANKAARDAQAGMLASYTGYQTDINMYWYYDGTRWNPMTITQFASLSVVNTQIPSPVSGQRVRIIGYNYDLQYDGTAWRAYGSGMFTVIPTTAQVTVTGGSATKAIDSQGKVTFGLVTSIALDGVFTSEFDNYLVTIINDTTSTASTLAFGFRRSGVLAVDLMNQRTIAQNGGGPVSGTPAAATTETISPTAADRGMYELHIYGPARPQPVHYQINAWTHDVGVVAGGMTGHGDAPGTTARDGIIFNVSSGTASGIISIKGYR